MDRHIHLGIMRLIIVMENINTHYLALNTYTINCALNVIVFAKTRHHLFTVDLELGRSLEKLGRIGGLVADNSENGFKVSKADKVFNVAHVGNLNPYSLWYLVNLEMVLVMVTLFLECLGFLCYICDLLSYAQRFIMST